MIQIETKKIYLIDALPYAAEIERKFNNYLLPVGDAIYDNNIKSKDQYHAMLSRLRGKHVCSKFTNDMEEDFFDDVNVKRGLAIINAYIEMLLHNKSAWVKGKIANDEMLGRFLKREYKEDDAVMDSIFDFFHDLRQNITDFIGNDEWTMHFQSYRKSDIVIEKTIDYRVYHWHIEHDTGENNE